jgi:hypothetical protein
VKNYKVIIWDGSAVIHHPAHTGKSSSLCEVDLSGALYEVVPEGDVYRPAEETTEPVNCVDCLAIVAHCVKLHNRLA